MFHFGATESNCMCPYDEYIPRKWKYFRIIIENDFIGTHFSHCPNVNLNLSCASFENRMRRLMLSILCIIDHVRRVKKLQKSIGKWNQSHLTNCSILRSSILSRFVRSFHINFNCRFYRKLVAFTAQPTKSSLFLDFARYNMLSENCGSSLFDSLWCFSIRKASMFAVGCHSLQVFFKSLHFLAIFLEIKSFMKHFVLLFPRSIPFLSKKRKTMIYSIRTSNKIGIFVQKSFLFFFFFNYSMN